MDFTADKKLSSLEDNLKRLRASGPNGVEEQVKGNPKFSVVSMTLFPGRNLSHVLGFEVWVRGTADTMVNFSALKIALYTPGKNLFFEINTELSEKNCDFSDISPEKDCCFSKKFGDKDFFLSGEEIGVLRFKVNDFNGLPPGKPFKLFLGNSEGHILLSLAVPEKLSESTKIL